MIKLWKDEQGGVSIMVLSLIVLGMCMLAFMVGVDYVKQISTASRVKQHLNMALHGASLSVDKTKLAEGIISLDTVTASFRVQDQFAAIVRKNMGIDDRWKVLTSSYLEEESDFVVHELIYADPGSLVFDNLIPDASACSMFGSRMQCTVKLYEGTVKETTREIDEMLVGPSLLAVVEVEHEGVGWLNDEPVVIASVQEVRFQ
ncbi:hypothetical protein SY83_13000 [Paenibacillus swuensis]|uniref:Uncharacterized protein n=1 Tax=Paenibacillus swuensis TaxID=1178515 RepID=A0A172TJF3_9BACL|nr:hypothetical protein [Paenibacillus swuensis]ANE47034.1 hypothetical protein SY83_13000 [Paenibacillus swuensis]